MKQKFVESNKSNNLMSPLVTALLMAVGCRLIKDSIH